MATLFLAKRTNTLNTQLTLMETICWNLSTQLPDVLRVKWVENWILFKDFFLKVEIVLL